MVTIGMTSRLQVTAVLFFFYHKTHKKNLKIKIKKIYIFLKLKKKIKIFLKKLKINLFIKIHQEYSILW